MRKSAFNAMFLAAMFSGESPLYASTQAECLKAIETAKRFEQANRTAHALYLQDKSEASRCAFLNKSKEHLQQVARTGEICRSYEPQLAAKMTADSVAGLKALNSPKNTCNSKSKADLSAEKRCLDAQKLTTAKNEVFQRTLADYNGNKNNQTQCTFLRASLEYFTNVEKMLKTCEPILEPSSPSKVPENRERIQSIRASQTKFCN